MSNVCDFEGISKTECNLQHLYRNCRIKDLDDFERDQAGTCLCRAGLLNVKQKGMTIRYIMNRCLVMFFRGGKENVVQYWWNIISKLKVNKWSLPNGSATENKKNINVLPGQLFCRQCKAKFLLERDSLQWWWR